MPAYGSRRWYRRNSSINVHFLLAKKALMRPIEYREPGSLLRRSGKEMLEKINKLGIGPQGFGGKTTAIGLNIETMPTHIAGMPCAININCHVTRHKNGGDLIMEKTYSLPLTEELAKTLHAGDTGISDRNYLYIP